MWRLSFVLLPLMCVFVACTESSSYGQFIPAAKTTRNVYLFDVDLSDSTAKYDFSFYTRIDRPVFSSENRMEPFLLDIFWVSPSDVRMEECVYFPSWRNKVPYRSSVVPSEFGVWRIAVQVPEPPKGFSGLGILVTKQ